MPFRWSLISTKVIRDRRFIAYMEGKGVGSCSHRAVAGDTVGLGERLTQTQTEVKTGSKVLLCFIGIYLDIRYSLVG